MSTTRPSAPDRDAGSAAFFALTLAPAVMIVALLLRPFGMADLGWQLRLGEIILSQGNAWVSDQFAATHLGEPIVPNAWMAQVAFSVTRNLTGWTGLRALDTVIWLSGLLIAIFPELRRGSRPLAMLLALIVGFVVALPTASIRPQSFAAPMFAATLVLAQSRLSIGRTLSLSLVLDILWQNLHPSLSIAVAVLGASTLCQYWLDRRTDGREHYRLAVMTAVALIATVLTPAGIHIYRFSAYNTEASILMGATEWFPLWHPVNREFLLSAVLSGTIAAFIAWRNRAELKVTDWLPAAVCFALSLVAARFILFYAITLIPLISRARIGSPSSLKKHIRTIVAGLTLSGIFAALALVGMPLHIQKEAEIAAVERLATVVPFGTVFCDPAFGGTLIDRGNGRWTVSFDGRFYAYSRDEIAMFKGTAAPGVDLSSIERRYHPVAFLVSHSGSPALIARLKQTGSGWREIYSDEIAAAFVRAAPIR